MFCSKIVSVMVVLAILLCAIWAPVCVAEEIPQSSKEVHAMLSESKAEKKRVKYTVIPTNQDNADTAYLVENTAQATERFRICSGSGALIYRFDLTKYDHPSVSIAVGYDYLVSYSTDGGETYQVLANYAENSENRPADQTSLSMQSILWNKLRDAQSLHIKIECCSPDDAECGAYVRKIIVSHQVPSDEPDTDDTVRYTYGDLNQDGTLDAADALQVLQKSVNLIDFTKEQDIIADVNLDGRTDAADALCILQKSVSLLDQVPAQLKQDAFLHQHDRVVFVGDSTTDHDRNREDFYGLEGIGYGAYADGYVKQIHDQATWEFGTFEPLETINRGVAGIRSTEYSYRHMGEVCSLAPDVISVMLGINDTWRRYDSNNPTTAAQYEKSMRSILDSCLSVGARIVLLAPFAVPGSSVDVSRWHEEDLNEKIAVCEKLAAEYGALYIDTNKLLNDLQIQNPDIAYTTDGVHPSGDGCRAIAEKWLETVKAAGVYLYE